VNQPRSEPRPIAAETASRPHYPALDGLRGTAILLVVFLHNFGFMKYFFFGWLGVDLFFVLSGFLITGILLDSLGKKHFLKNFYTRRVLRIFPVYYLVLAICLFLVPLLQSPSFDMRYYQGNAMWLVVFLQNWLYIFKQPTGSTMLLHFWSLAVEEQFYLVWPAAIVFVRSPKKLLWIILAVLLTVMTGRYLLWSFHFDNLAYDSFYTFSRIDGICVGSMIAILLWVYPSFLKKFMPVIVLGLAALNFLMYFVNRNAEVRLPYLAFIGYTTFSVMFGFLVHEAVTGSSRIMRLIFENGLLRFFGKISYGLYVYHWPIFLVLSPVFYQLFSPHFSSDKMAVFASSLTVTIVAVALSYLSFHFFEKYFLGLKNKFA
jgi:peptidoglycan/LPS O-acetylase OafA/YrhL